MWEQIRSNQTRTVILVVAMGLLLLLIGYFLGEAIFGSGIKILAGCGKGKTILGSGYLRCQEMR